MPEWRCFFVIIQSLCRHYDILADDEDSRISRPGYSQPKVSFALVISREGELTNIIDLRTDGKKPQPKMMEVPLQKSRANDITPYFACDNAKYIFGVEKVKVDPKQKVPTGRSHFVSVLEEGEDSIIGISKRSQGCFKQFRVLHHALLDKTDDPGVNSFLEFLDTWKPELTLNHPKIKEYKKEIFEGGFFVFKTDGDFLHKNARVQQAWDQQYSSQPDGEGIVAPCLVSGQLEQIAQTHQKIKGVYNAQSAGASLVSFNDRAFESYGKEQSFNAPISTSSMFKYTTVLNYLLDRSNKNKLQIGDTTTVFWADTRNKVCEDLASFFFDPREVQEDAKEKTPENVRLPDKKTLQLVGDILNKVRNGQYLQEHDLGINPVTTNFFVLGLSPNNARLAVRYWYQDNFGNFITRVARHHLDMEIVRDDNGPHYISVYRLLKETIPQSSTDKAASPLLGGLLMRAILGNTQYPVQMYNAILSRVKVERSINYVRAGFIKAYLLRLARYRLTDIKEDLITVSLNEESLNVPYRLGRLFAVLEKVQSETNKEMKSTINSKYFSSASTTPAVVFPVLLKLAQHHIAKSDWGFKTNHSIEEILMGIDEFPAFLTLEDQGMFMIGYYHQRKAFFKKKETSPEKEVTS
jgi:CRISPR-associated protein Csd1